MVALNFSSSLVSHIAGQVGSYLPSCPVLPPVSLRPTTTGISLQASHQRHFKAAARMGVGPLVVEIVCTFCLAASLLYKYGNWYKHHIIVTLSVLVAWYFSFIIIFILPLDVSSTAYRQCKQEQSPTNPDILFTTESWFTVVPRGNYTDNVTTPAEPNSTWQQDASLVVTGQGSAGCVEPWSFLSESVLPDLWRVVYWTSQCLTWLILPIMQSYTQAGDFTVGGKLKAALIDNAIYYGSYLFIAGILLIYIVVKPQLDLDGSKLKAIAAAASNTWGLFLLVLLLGYGLVEVPRTLWHTSKRGHMLNYCYFKASKICTEKSESEENLDDILEALQVLSDNILTSHPLRQHVETILQKVPVEYRDRMSRRHTPEESVPAETPTEKSLVRLHRQVIHALQYQHQTETRWNMLVDHILHLEDISRNEVSNDHNFKSTFQKPYPHWLRAVYTPRMEWYWKCVMRGYFLKILAVVAGVTSVLVVWSEVTFFNKEVVLSVFAIFVNLAKKNYDYFSIEVVSCLTISYLCVCTYYTVFKVRVLNYYYLAPYHQTQEYSLIFSGMLLCRLTPPLCLNFLGLIHMDSHVIRTHVMETHYTQIMGHMDVVSIVSDGFNIYFPMGILVLCLATYFSLGSRFLSFVGFQQFIGDDDITTDLVDEGKELIKREKRRRQRLEDTASRKREFKERFGSNSAYRTSRQRAEDRVRPLKREDSSESARLELLGDTEPVDYTGGSSDLYSDFEVSDSRTSRRYQAELETIRDDTRHSTGGRVRVGSPPQGIFDDV